MRNAGLEEAQAGIKIAGRNTTNLRYADNTTLMTESEEELKSLFMKVKEEVSGHKCESGGTGTPELPGLVLREGKLETGSVPTVKCPGLGSSADMSLVPPMSKDIPRSPCRHHPRCAGGDTDRL